jgi:hypothetical protein
VGFGGYDWLVLEVQDGKALLLSEYALYFLDHDRNRYHGVYEPDLSLKEKYAKYATSWADCDLRAYLNGEFYDSFGADEQARIMDTHNENQNNQWWYDRAMASGADGWIPYAPEGGADTTDKIFILSLEEVVRYLGDSGQLANRPDDDTYMIDDQFNEERVVQVLNGGYSVPWWLRSPGMMNYKAAVVSPDGYIMIGGSDVWSDSCKARPAMWVNLE